MESPEEDKTRRDENLHATILDVLDDLMRPHEDDPDGGSWLCDVSADNLTGRIIAALTSAGPALPAGGLVMEDKTRRDENYNDGWASIQFTLPGVTPYFRTELKQLLNKHSMERNSHTADWILADYLLACLNAYEEAVNARGGLPPGSTIEFRNGPAHLKSALYDD